MPGRNRRKGTQNERRQGFKTAPRKGRSIAMKIVQRFARPPDMGAAFALAEPHRAPAGWPEELASSRGITPTSPRPSSTSGPSSRGASSSAKVCWRSVPDGLSRTSPIRHRFPASQASGPGRGQPKMRNRATIGGNIAADRSSSAFIPLFSLSTRGPSSPSSVPRDRQGRAGPRSESAAPSDLFSPFRGRSTIPDARLTAAGQAPPTIPRSSGGGRLLDRCIAS